MLIWLIMRNPETSIPLLRAHSMCCRATSASVQWVATRTLLTPRSRARCRSSMVPMPGSSNVVSRARCTVAAATSSHRWSLCRPKP